MRFWPLFPDTIEIMNHSKIALFETSSSVHFMMHADPVRCGGFGTAWRPYSKDGSSGVRRLLSNEILELDVMPILPN
jgi:hypothetical protein